LISPNRESVDEMFSVEVGFNLKRLAFFTWGDWTEWGEVEMLLLIGFLGGEEEYVTVNGVYCCLSLIFRCIIPRSLRSRR